MGFPCVKSRSREEGEGREGNRLPWVEGSWGGVGGDKGIGGEDWGDWNRINGVETHVNSSLVHPSPLAAPFSFPSPTLLPLSSPSFSSLNLTFSFLPRSGREQALRIPDFPSTSLPSTTPPHLSPYPSPPCLPSPLYPIPSPPIFKVHPSPRFPLVPPFASGRRRVHRFLGVRTLPVNK